MRAVVLFLVVALRLLSVDCGSADEVGRRLTTRSGYAERAEEEGPVVENEVDYIVFYPEDPAHRTRGLPDVPALQCRFGVCGVTLSGAHCERMTPSEWKCIALVQDVIPGHTYHLRNTDVECQGFENQWDTRVLLSSCFLAYDLYVIPFSEKVSDTPYPSPNRRRQFPSTSSSPPILPPHSQLLAPDPFVSDLPHVSFSPLPPFRPLQSPDAVPTAHSASSAATQSLDATDNIRTSPIAPDNIRATDPKPSKFGARMHVVAAKWISTLESAASGMSELCSWAAFTEWALTPTGIFVGAVAIATTVYVCGLDCCCSKRNAQRLYSVQRDADDLDLPLRAHAALQTAAQRVTRQVTSPNPEVNLPLASTVCDDTRTVPRSKTSDDTHLRSGMVSATNGSAQHSDPIGQAILKTADERERETERERAAHARGFRMGRTIEALETRKLKVDASTVLTQTTSPRVLPKAYAPHRHTGDTSLPPAYAPYHSADIETSHTFASQHMSVPYATRPPVAPHAQYILKPRKRVAQTSLPVGTITPSDEGNHFADESNHFADESNHFADESNRFANESNHFANEINHFADENNRSTEENDRSTENVALPTNLYPTVEQPRAKQISVTGAGAGAGTYTSQRAPEMEPFVMVTGSGASLPTTETEPSAYIKESIARQAMTETERRYRFAGSTVTN
jgi:hypothetical protein